MAATLEKISDNVAHFSIEVESSKFEEGINKAYLKNAQKFAVPGFRKGKAPRKIIEKFYGEGIFYEDAINIILPEEYDNAVKQLNIEPVDKPEIDIEQLGGDGKNLVIKVSVTLKPEVKLGKYKGIEIKKVEYNVTEEDVENEVKLYRERNARLVTIDDRPVRKGDIVTIDYVGKKDGEEFAGGKGENYELTIGSGKFIPGFEDGLIGKNAGDEVTVNVTFPDDYHAEELKGAKAVFEVKIHSIKEKQLPAPDDEFAKDVSEFDTFEEFKNDIKEKLTERAQRNQKAETENNVVNAVVENTTIDIPACMIDARIDSMLSDYEMRLRQQGLTLEKYLEILNMKIEDLKAQFKDEAERQVKTSLTLEQIGKQENIAATDDEVEKEYNNMADLYKLSVDKIKKIVHEDEIKKDIVIRKTVELLVSNAAIK
jgi:trigger factor